MTIISYVLTSSLILPLLLVLPLLIFVAYCVYNIAFHPLRNIPGPWIAAISPLWEVYIFLQGHAHYEHIRLHQKYGPVVRLAPNTIILNDPNDYTAYWNWAKADWWLGLKPHPVHAAHASIFEVNEHKKRKKLIMGAYQMSEIIKSEYKIDKHINTLVRQFKSRIGTTFDLSPWTQYAAFDIVMDIAFSNPIGFLEAATDVDGIIHSLHGLLVAANLMAYFPSVLRIVHHPKIFPLIAPQPTDKSGPGRIYGLAHRQVKMRHQDLQNTSKQFGDILQWIIDRHALNTDDPDSQKLMTWQVLEQEASNPIVAGSDTIASMVRTAILYLTTTPRALRRFLSEIDAADEKGLFSDVVQYNEIRAHVPYTEALCKEVLRMYPPAGSPLPREVPAGGVKLGDYHVPAGTSVAISQWAVARNPLIWGDDADVFRPERWEDIDAASYMMDDSFDEHGNQVQSSQASSGIGQSEAEKQRRLRDAGFVFFANGPMMCTGRHIAQLEMFKIVVQLFRIYDFQLVNALQPVKDINRFAMIQWDYMVRVTERQNRPKKSEKVV